MEKIDTDWKTTKLKSLAKLFKPFNRDWAPLNCDKDHNYGDIILANQNTCQENNPAPCWCLFTEKNTRLDCATLLHKDTRYCER